MSHSVVDGNAFVGVKEERPGQEIFCLGRKKLVDCLKILAVLVAERLDILDGLFISDE